MEQRVVGWTGERTGAIGLGCMGLVGWYGERDDAEAAATIHRALDLGITHLDTAAIYQDGDNERFVGAAIRGRRHEVFLATKCGQGRRADGTIGADNRPSTIRTSCDASLQRLGVDHIDLFYLHRIDADVPIEDSMGVMADLVRAGKVRHVGLSEASAATLRRAHRVHPVAALQSELSLWTRSAAADGLAACRELDIAFVAYSPLGRGFLTGTIASPAALAPGDTRRVFPRFAEANFERNRRAALRVGELAAARGCTPAQLALAWVLARDPLVLPIPGTKRRRYLDENAAAAGLSLSAAELAALAAAIPEDEVAGDRYPASMMGTLNV
ncbi:MAG: aldo/keto reductase [Chromatiales bacterium]|jgi:aryl-alcohol dehydrogenase-like predicted oxidoreductase|nr:aldo/keto reductase [Chromatiales bacterium]